MKNKIYYIKEFGAPGAQQLFQGQIETLFDKNKFLPVQYPKGAFSKLIFLIKFFFKVRKGDILFFIHPLYARTNQLILNISLFKKCTVVCIVSDINSLRNVDMQVDKEISYWARIRYFIFQNDRMKSFAEMKVGNKDSVNIQLFDLLFTSPEVKRNNSNEIVFAGNTSKCPFIKDLFRITDVQWNIYSGNDVQRHQNVNPVLLSNEVTDRQLLAGSYGLVWEGESITDISNFNGQYLKWVSPLKLSNYLLSSLPIIIHEDAAMAEFVVQNKIGFCVSSLFEIGEKIKLIPEADYQQMVENARRFSIQISCGYYTQKAIEGILEKINPPE